MSIFVPNRSKLKRKLFILPILGLLFSGCGSGMTTARVGAQDFPPDLKISNHLSENRTALLKSLKPMLSPSVKHPTIPRLQQQNQSRGPVGFNSSNLVYYMANNLFINAMMSASGNNAEGFLFNGADACGAPFDLMNVSTNRQLTYAGGNLEDCRNLDESRDSNGYATRLPNGTYLQFMNFASLDPGEDIATRYFFIYEGDGDFQIFGKGSTTQRIEINENLKVIVIDMSPGELGPLFFRQTRIGQNYAKNFHLVPVHLIENYLNGERFSPVMLEALANAGVFRTMDYQRTNGSPVINPEDVPGPLGLQASSSGIALEWIFYFAAKTGIDIWITIPHQASSRYIEKIGNLVEEYLGSSSSKVIVEYSNEIWNSSFSQYRWLVDEADRRELTGPNHEKLQRAASERMVELFTPLKARFPNKIDIYYPSQGDNHGVFMAGFDHLYRGQRIVDRVIQVENVSYPLITGVARGLYFSNYYRNFYWCYRPGGEPCDARNIDEQESNIDAWTAIAPADFIALIAQIEADAITRGIKSTFTALRSYRADLNAVVYEGGPHLDNPFVGSCNWNGTRCVSQAHRQKFEQHIQAVNAHPYLGILTAELYRRFLNEGGTAIAHYYLDGKSCGQYGCWRSADFNTFTPLIDQRNKSSFNKFNHLYDLNEEMVLKITTKK